MTNVIKFSIFAGVIAIAFGLFAFVPAVSNTVGNSLFAPIVAFAWDTDFGGDCCGGDYGGGDYGGGGSDCHLNPSYPGCNPPTPSANCDLFTASPSTLPYGGGSVTLTWNTTNATSVSINQGIGSVSADGSTSVNVNGNTTWTLTAVGAGGNDSCTAQVTVAPSSVANCDLFTASPSTLPHGGGSVTLTWNTTNATSVSINNGIGSVSADGSTSINVTNSTTWTLTAAGTNGNDTCTAQVTVNPPQSGASCDFFNANDTSLPEGGGNVTLSWGTTNATSVSINNGVGTVSADGSTVVHVNNDITYTLTANGTNGNDTCQVHIEVDEDDNDEPRCDFFTVSDSSVEEGDRVTLEWGTTNADDVSINQGIGDVSSDGSRNVTVYDDTTFVLTVENDEGEDTCRVSVEVDEDEDDNDPKPRCELDISDDKVKKGTKVTLEWETSNADEIEIEDDKGKEIFESDKSKYMDGEIDVIINRDTEFTLIAKGDGGKRECEVDVEVEDDVVVFEKRDQPLVISLASVPYTGFEAGKALTFLFYALLTLWALFIAYVLVIKKDSVLGFSLAGFDKQAAAKLRETEEYKKKLEMLVRKHTHRPWM